MGLYKELCVVFMVTILFSILLLYESRELDGYKFPVYSTEFCPRNQTEWDERSSAINCTENNGYMCLPNQQRTELIEFCYKERFAWVEEGVCLYLIKGSSRVEAYNCVQFISGCPTSNHRSSESYKYQSCFAIENGCFIAEPSCNREYAEESTVHKDSINNNSNSWVTPVAISLGFFVPVCVSCILVIFYYKNGHGSCKRSSDEDAHASGEIKPFLEKNERYKESERDHVVFEDWEHIDFKFIQTKACKRVESLIQKENLVIVVGHSGSGKSATIQHIALKYRRDGWVVKKANEVKDAIDALRSNNVLENQTLFVLHDPIGKESFDELAYNSWKKLEENLKACSEKCKLLLSCRKCVQSDERAMGLFKNKSIIVDIDAEDCKLSDDEKLKIWNKYKSDNTSIEIDVTEIIKIDAYFPLLCKLFFSDEENQKKGLQFFKEPVKVYKEEIECYKTSSKDKFCALVLLVLFNNELCVSDLLKEGNSEQMYKRAFKLCGMENCTAPSIRCALETLNGSYVTKIGDIYQFCHDFVMEVTSHVFGTVYPTAMIQYADIGFLRKRVKFDGCNDQNDQITIYIGKKHLGTLTERLLKEMVGKKLFDVVLNPCLNDKKVADAMIENIKMQPEKINLLNEKIELFLETQNFYLESKDLFFTKLDFAGLEYNLSPLCALIIFGHTGLSIYCLQALQQGFINYKDSSFFFAVCCNGAIDLFNMFSNNDIETYLEKKLLFLYPIHIVSAFYNYEILEKLIELGVDVNQSDEDGGTALMYAVRNIAGVSEDNYTNVRHYRTLQLLLRKGAKINSCDRLGRTPLYIACKNGHAKPFQLLLHRETGINFCNAVKRSLLEIFILRFELSQRVLSDEFGLSHLYTACYYGEAKMAEHLLNHGADINLCDTFGNSPLYVACQNNFRCIVQLLLRYEADINLCNKFGISPLYVSCYNRDSSTVKLLLDHGADANLSDTFGTKPFDVACFYRCNSIVELLQNHRANTNSCDLL